MIGLARAAFTVFVAWRKLICGRLSLSLTSFFTADQWVAPPWRMQSKNTQIYRLKANSYHHARHDETGLSVWRPLRRRELDFRQPKTVADRKFEVWTRPEQLSSSHRHTGHDSDRTVLSCLVWRCELGITCFRRTAFVCDADIIPCRALNERTFALLDYCRISEMATVARRWRKCRYAAPGWVTLIIGPY